MKLFHDKSGQTLVLAALSLPALLGFMRLALDVGMLMHDKRDMQIAADAAAIAAAGEIPNTDYTAVGQAASAQNGATNGAGGAKVVINNPHLSGPFASVSNKTSYVEAVVSSTESTTFMGLFGPRVLTVSARAVATPKTNSDCIYALGN